MTETGSRSAQRRRTRKAIVDATAQLLSSGVEPTIAEICQAAEVSRRTLYLYFPSLDQLLLDAALAVMATAEHDYHPDSYGSDVRARVRGLAETLLDMSERALPVGRKLIRLTVESDQTGPKRGYRRTEWIEQAVEPLRGSLDDERVERLVSALSIVLGWEAMIVLRDIRDLSPEAERATTLWAAMTLVDAALSGTAASSGSGRPLRVKTEHPPRDSR